jgi:hypothetical protein
MYETSLLREALKQQTIEKGENRLKKLEQGTKQSRHGRCLEKGRGE